MYAYNDDPAEKSFKAWTRVLIKMDRHAEATRKYAAGLKGGDHEGERLLLDIRRSQLVAADDDGG
jgi:hypothetical protein